MSSLKRDLETLAAIQKRTVQEVVDWTKKRIIDSGADPEKAAEFFTELDAVAELYVNQQEGEH